MPSRLLVSSRLFKASTAFSSVTQVLNSSSVIPAELAICLRPPPKSPDWKMADWLRNTASSTA